MTWSVEVPATDLVQLGMQQLSDLLVVLASDSLLDRHS
jgi:hypothetical protein